MRTVPGFDHCPYCHRELVGAMCAVDLLPKRHHHLHSISIHPVFEFGRRVLELLAYRVWCSELTGLG